MKWPEVGSEFVLDSNEDSEEPVEGRVIELLGAARLYKIRVAGCRAEGIIALQPSGSWWWVREPEEPEPWAPS